MRLFALVLAAFVLATPAALAAEEFEIVIKDHKFDPAELKVPANQAVTLRVSNKDATPEEFESHALDVEKVIAGNQEAVIHILPLKPGRYTFVGEYHEDTAKGALVAE